MQVALRLPRPIEELRQQYTQAEPFAHIVLSDLFNAAPIDLIRQEVEQFSNWDGEKNFFGSQKKFHCRDWEKLPARTRAFLKILNSEGFCKFLSDLTGIQHLVADPTLEGGGIHCIKRGGFLKVHSDFNFHHKLKLHRRLNLLLYLNQDWQSDWGGALELWDQSMTQCVKRVLPTFNTVVIFSTTDQSFHGHPDPLNCPENRLRNSLAVYYYTADRPSDELTQRGLDAMTDYRPRPGEAFKPPV